MAETVSGKGCLKSVSRVEFELSRHKEWKGIDGESR